MDRDGVRLSDLTIDNVRIRWDWNDVTQNPIIVFDATPVPEPATLILLGAGLIGLGIAKRKGVGVSVRRGE